MEGRIKGILLSAPIIALGGLFIGGALELRKALEINHVTALYFIGAIILAIGLAILDVKYHRKSEHG